jgi:hypothetical protein
MLFASRDDCARDLIAKDRQGTRELVVDLLRRAGSTYPTEDADLVMAAVTGLTLESLTRGGSRAFDDRAVRNSERLMECVLGLGGERPRVSQDGAS